MSSLARLAMASLFRSTDRAHVRRRFRAGAARMNANLVIGAERILRKRKAPGRGADPALSPPGRIGYNDPIVGIACGGCDGRSDACAKEGAVPEPLPARQARPGGDRGAGDAGAGRTI